MRQPLFTGSFDLTLDEKARLLVPASLRKRIDPAVHGEAYYLQISPERRLWMYPDKYFEWLFSVGQEADSIPQRDLLMYDRLTLGMAVEVEADKGGRIVIPEASRKRVGLGKDVTLVGNRDHVEIWNTPAWIEYSDKLLDQGDDLRERARSARRGEPVTLRTQTVTGLDGAM